VLCKLTFVLPYIRITILLKSQKKPLKNIRLDDTTNIDVLQNKYNYKSSNHYGHDLIDCEVAIISKTCKAARNWLEAKANRLNKKKETWELNKPLPEYIPTEKSINTRKVKLNDGRALGDRMDE
jgi:hypothetical protein